MSKKKDNSFQGATMTADGMQYNGQICKNIVEQCQGCERVREFEGASFCSSYPAPEVKWRSGRCNFATHMRATAGAQAKVNPLKASKRASRGK